jgi:hypothetical protein
LWFWTRTPALTLLLTFIPALVVLFVFFMTDSPFKFDLGSF